MKNVEFSHTLLLDGPTGTELQRRGFDTHLPLWSARALLEAPEVVEQIHREYIAAGAGLITTNSFRTNRRVVERAGYSSEDAKDLTHLSAQLAKRAISLSGREGIVIAGSDAPVEDCYSPDLVPTDAELREEHEEHIAWLVEANCDLVLIETMNTLREAMIASEVAASFDIPFIVSLVTDTTGRSLLSGELLSEGVRYLAEYQPAAILTNCSAPRAVLKATEILAEVKRSTNAEWEFGGYANSGEPDPVLGWDFVQTVPIDRFVASAIEMVNLGARLIGSCCGTTPEYTKELAEAVGSG
ncbi:MAG: homocysteine S-methyltransferase family protein [Ignavibacteriae bacterium]|nr:homocysteine S-methyltransferase family protein [Ignavibacteriota bacterium]MCB9217540.1 homocysteine S-methyltransferase family protein [Ignavibacteria bacterium]